jgi:hypothetical protein
MYPKAVRSTFGFLNALRSMFVGAEQQEQNLLVLESQEAESERLKPVVQTELDFDVQGQ